MNGLGVGISLVSGRPRAFAVRATADGDEIKYDLVLEHWADQAEDDVQQLRTLAAKFETLLITEKPAAVVIRRMDWTGTTKREVVAKRGRAEGVVGAVVRAKIPACRFASGQEIAALCGSTKAAVETEAATILGDDKKAAVAAARAALAIAA